MTALAGMFRFAPNQEQSESDLNTAYDSQSGSKDRGDPEVGP